MAEHTDKQKAARKRLSGNLKSLRGEHRMSQEALADRAGLHRTYISQVERELVNVSLDNIVLLAEALNVQVVDLLKETQDAPVPLKSGRKSNPADAPAAKKARHKEL
jgi:transcriptional regulator with XRE-family HTH domain